MNFFVEDPLRLFRVMQFAARLQMEPNEELNKVCKTMDISSISSERIEEEFKKLFLKSKKPSMGLKWLQTIGRWSELFPDIKEQEELYKAVDCVAKIQNLSNTQKLAAIWSCFVYSYQNISIDITKPIEKSLKTSVKQCVKQYVHSHEVLDQAVLLGCYVAYVQLLGENGKASDYKWLAYWLSSDISLELLSNVARCWNEKKVVDDFIQQAQRAGVFYKAEEPLVTGKNLLHLAQGKELGDLVKQAYKIQINQNVSDQSVLLAKLNKDS